MNLDKLQLKPNQLADFDPTECTAITWTVIMGNYLGIPLNPDFTYAASLAVQGIAPTDVGSDPRAAAFSGCLYGALPQTDETFTAKTVGELYASSFSNYTFAEHSQAARNTVPFTPLSPDWATVVKTLQSGLAVSLPMRWYWGANPPIVLTMPDNIDAFTLHNVVVWDSGDSRGLTIQPWLGTQGENGYFYLPENVFNIAQDEQPFCLNPTGNRWKQIISMAFTYYPVIIDIAKELLSI